MLDIGPGEILVLAIAALFIFGPDRLPTMAKQAGRWVRDLRMIVANARRDLKEQAGVDLGDVSLSDLNPRGLVRRHLLDDSDLDLGLNDLNPLSDSSGRPKATGKSGSSNGSATANGAQRAEGSAPRFDPDAT